MERRKGFELCSLWFNVEFCDPSQIYPYKTEAMKYDTNPNNALL